MDKMRYVRRLTGSSSPSRNHNPQKIIDEWEDAHTALKRPGGTGCGVPEPEWSNPFSFFFFYNNESLVLTRLAVQTVVTSIDWQQEDWKSGRRT
jgi:hypothetical protein